jgi:hypothetical protein
MRNWVLFLFVVSGFWSNAQSYNALTPTDTLRYSSRYGGEIDSIDLFNSFLSSTNPAGSISANNTFTSNWLFVNHGAQLQQNFNDWQALKFSGLPHIGFNYSFGSQGVQNVCMNYQQNFGKNLTVNLEYKKNKANGYLRNSAYAINDIQFQLAKRGKFFSFHTQALYVVSDFQVNDGLIEDSLADDFALRLLPVQNDNASHKNQRTKIEHTNFFDLNKDSLNAVGFYTNHQLAIRNLRYTEEKDSLQYFYSKINYDSTLTMDQNQWSSLNNGVGLFFKNRRSALSIGGDMRYWKYDNLIYRNDTTEINLVANYQFNSQRFVVSNYFKQNIYGAKQEMENRFASLLKLNKSTIGLSARFENLLPELHQRFNYANNYDYKLENPSTQSRFYGDLRFSTILKFIDVDANISFVQLKDNYFFIDTIWRNDTLTNVSLTQFNLRADYRLKQLHLQPSYTYSLSNSSIQFTPNHQVNLRVFVKGGLFKAKKLQAYLGVDASYVSRFNAIEFNVLSGSYDFWNGNAVNNGFANLHFFTGFQIDEFKFYVRYENIGYFWNQHSLPVLSKHPIAGTQFRFGLTWDFFN